MKKVLGILTICLIGVFAFGSLFDAHAEEVTEELTANQKAYELFSTFYNEGTYKKDTVINVNEDVLEETKTHFHSNITILERTTYYKGNELWMSNGNGYSGYGTSEDGKLTTFAVTRDRTREIERVNESLPGMEEHYCTLADFVNGSHNSQHVDSEIVLNNDWEEVEGRLVSTNEDILEGFRLFTAPLWLNTEESRNYLSYNLAMIEEEHLDDKEGAKNLTRLVMKLWTDNGDEGKFAINEQFVYEGKTYNLFSKAYVYKDFIENLEGNGTESDPYLIRSDEDWSNFITNNKTLQYKYNGEYVKLMEDVHANEISFTTTNYAFRGTLDGNGHKVTADINGGDRSAVIGYLGRSGIIKNLTVTGSVNGGENTSGLVALSYGVIDNCVNEAAISATGDNVGGIVGWLCSDGKVYNSVNKADVTAVESNCVGGIAGFATGTNTVVEGCSNQGNITSLTAAGGIVGYVNSAGAKDNKYLRVNNCSNSGNIQAQNYVAGVVAENYGAVILNSTNSGEILATTPTSDNSYFAGGICANSQTSIMVTEEFTIRVYTSKTSYTEKTLELTGTIINCSNSGKVYTDNSEATTIKKVAGIVAYLNKNKNTGVLIACYNSGEVIGTGQTAGVIGISESTTTASSSKYCYQLGKTVHNPSGTYASKRWNSNSTTLGTLLGYRSGAVESNICLDLTSSAEEGLCAYFSK